MMKQINLTSDDKVYSCIRCLYTSKHPLGLTVDADGVCSGCRVHEEKNTLDWDVRWDKLKSLVKPYKIRSAKTYDCIVPVTGGNDSYYIVHLVKERLGLNPLLVSYNKYFNTPLGIRNLSNLRIRFNCDILIQNINPIAVKKITRTTFRELGSIYWHCLAGQTVFPVQTALRYKVPLIIWGAHQGLEQVGMFSHEHEVEMTRRYRKDHDLMGIEADDLLSNFDTLTEDDVWQYRYPDDSSLSSVGVRGIYLGNFVRWDPKTQHELMVNLYGYQGSKFQRTFDTYDHVDCFNFMGLHDELKIAKHGYSKVLDHACREIRHGRLTRQEGIALVNHYQLRLPDHVDKFCEWLGINSLSMRFIVNQHRNKEFWKQDEKLNWVFKQVNLKFNKQEVDECINKLGFVAQSNTGKYDSYVTIGKGYPV